METEIPALFAAHQRLVPEDGPFTFHSSRMRMKKVVKEELEAMDRDSLRCAAELADAAVDVVGYACLVAIMSMGRGYHRESEARLGAKMQAEGSAAPVITSAGALIDELKLAGVESIALVTPYLQPLTELVVDYIRSEGIQVVGRRGIVHRGQFGCGPPQSSGLAGRHYPFDYTRGSGGSNIGLRPDAISRGDPASRRQAWIAGDIGSRMHGAPCCVH